MNQNKKLIIIIPAYEPDFHLPELIDKLNNYFNDFKMIVVNDGSKSHDDIFNKVKEKDNVTLLTHKENRGKGEALKTAFRYIKELNIDSIIITADSDGQHKPEDIKKVYNFYLKHEDTLVLGSRKFENEVPKRSSFGNDVSRILLRIFENKHLNDTQTGLRAFSSNLLDFLLNVKGSRFEYEMNMLAEAVRENINIYEIAIETIYIDENKASHFRPVRDFSRISACLIKYGLPSLIACIIDFIAFTIFMLIFKDSTIFEANLFSALAGFISIFSATLINVTSIFYGNKNILKRRARGLRFFITCFILVILNMCLLSVFKLFMENYIIIRIITNLILLILLMISNYFILKKSVLYEE